MAAASSSASGWALLLLVALCQQVTSRAPFAPSHRALGRSPGVRRADGSPPSSPGPCAIARGRLRSLPAAAAGVCQRARRAGQRAAVRTRLPDLLPRLPEAFPSGRLAGALHLRQRLHTCVGHQLLRRRGRQQRRRTQPSPVAFQFHLAGEHSLGALGGHANQEKGGGPRIPKPAPPISLLSYKTKQGAFSSDPFFRLSPGTSSFERRSPVSLSQFYTLSSPSSWEVVFITLVRPPPPKGSRVHSPILQPSSYPGFSSRLSCSRATLCADPLG